MLGVRISRAAVLACAVALSACAVALGAPAVTPPNPCTLSNETNPVIATTSRVGHVDLHFVGAQGAAVSFFECIGARAVALGSMSQPGDFTDFYGASTWRCKRLSRHFAATATLPDGTAAHGTGSVRTVSCARRFFVTVSPRVARGRKATVRIADRWKVGGVRTRLCVTPPGRQRSCRSVVLGRSLTATRHFRPRSQGRWRVELLATGADVRNVVAVGVRNLAAKVAPPTVLATGDSTMEGVSSFLSDDLGSAANLVSDVRPGFALSKDLAVNPWQPIARAQIARLHPSTTVISMGANEGLPMRAADGVQHACCDEPWIAEYVRRVKQTMLTYRRGGRARVFWLTIVAPRSPARAPVFAAINRAIVLAGAQVPGVRVLRMDSLFSANGYQETIRDHGRDVHVREADGIHLNVAGTRIAAREIVRAMRAG